MFLVFVACLIAAPTRCEEERLRLPDGASTVQACWTGAPALLIEWEKAHPDYKASMDWRCVPESRLQRRS
ncbi:hypothetical protein HNR00_002340 [Methylorubrum rhodinum]|uniref:Uncharacterized protein n=1 Tax=Methylorubrum rhodinum TaxID=29428 RepID=A0A840ZJ78_9HYPH|nr:hypothetical protein [Methylorubrum rhodinum]MBB5757626.1 hypothetical protein [Methylorubrum rhodinum]